MRCPALLAAALLLAAASCAAAYTCDATTCTPPSCLCGSTKTPGGLAPADTPQFVLITHDDSVNTLQNRLVRTVTDGFKNPNGCNVPATWFALKDKTNCTFVQQLLNDNHEIAGHTLDHMRLDANLTREEVAKQVEGVRDWMVDTCKVPADKFKGFRAPYLVHNPQYREVLAAAGYEYDSTIIEPFNTASSPSWAERLWPYTMDAGIPQDCAWVGDGSSVCTATEKYAGLWELPLWNLPDEDGNNAWSMDVESKDVKSADALFELLKKDFDAAYAGNRAPFPLFVHAPWFTFDNIEASTRFIEYAQEKEGVWFVTASQLLDWMKNPVPISQMNTTMTCDNLVQLTPPTVEYCRQYKAGPVEDIWTVGARFGVSSDEALTSVNPGLNIWTIPEGTVVNIPPWDDRCDKPGATVMTTGDDWYNPVYIERPLAPVAAPSAAPGPSAAPVAAPVAAPTAGPDAAPSPVDAPSPAAAPEGVAPAPAPAANGAAGTATSAAVAGLAGLAAFVLMI